MFIVNGITDPPYNNKWVLGGCETVCKSGCFDRVTLSDDDGRCNHSFYTARAGAKQESGGVEPGGPTPVRCTPTTGRPNWTTTAQREAKRARPPGLSQSSPVFWVRAPASSQNGRQPCTTFWARTPVHQLILDTQSDNTMVVLNPNQNSTSSSEAASRMSAQYLSSLYVQPLPHEVSC